MLPSCTFRRFATLALVWGAQLGVGSLPLLAQTAARSSAAVSDPEVAMWTGCVTNPHATHLGGVRRIGGDKRDGKTRLHMQAHQAARVAGMRLRFQAHYASLAFVDPPRPAQGHVNVTAIPL